MAPTRTVLAKHLRTPTSTHSKSRSSTTTSKPTSSKPTTRTHPTLTPPRSAKSPLGAKQHKPAPPSKPTNPRNKPRRRYTEKELGVPTLNAITPVGVAKPKGGKKGKVFVDDGEGMMTILKMVQMESEGRVEGKMAKARRLEEIREARRAEQEKRDQERRGKFVSFPEV